MNRVTRLWEPNAPRPDFIASDFDQLGALLTAYTDLLTPLEDTP